MSNAAHPGATRSNLQTTGPLMGTGKSSLGLLGRLQLHIPGMWQNVDTGALPTLYATTSPDAQPDGYYGPDGKPFGLRGHAGAARRSQRAKDTAVAARLWDASVTLTGVSWGVTLPA
jgi:hypothetical protein